MSTKTEMQRTENMNLLQFLHGGGKRLKAILRDRPLRHYISALTLGKKNLLGYEARSLEQKLGHPDGWFERDNVGLLKLSKDDFEVVSLLLNASQEEKAAISALLARYRPAISVNFGGTPQLRVV